MEAKTAHYDSVGKQIPSGKVGHRQKRVLRSRKGTSARSVDSQCESPAIEPRNNSAQESLPSICAGTTPKHRSGKVSRSCRGLRTGQTHKRVVREHGKSNNVLVWTNGEKGQPRDQKPNLVKGKGPLLHRSQEQAGSQDKV